MRDSYHGCPGSALSSPYPSVAVEIIVMCGLPPFEPLHTRSDNDGLPGKIVVVCRDLSIRFDLVGVTRVCGWRLAAFMGFSSCGVIPVVPY